MDFSHVVEDDFVIQLSPGDLVFIDVGEILSRSRNVPDEMKVGRRVFFSPVVERASDRRVIMRFRSADNSVRE